MEGTLKLGGYLFVAMLLAAALHSPPALSQQAGVGDLVILQPWSRAAPRGAEQANSYLTIENKGTTADRLVGGSADVAEKIQIQQISKVGGGTVVRPVDGGLGIGAGEKLVLAPGGYFLALLNLKGPLKNGTKVPVTLEFEKAGRVTVSFDVLGAASKGPAPPKGSPGSPADDNKKK